MLLLIQSLYPLLKSRSSNTRRREREGGGGGCERDIAIEREEVRDRTPRKHEDLREEPSDLSATSGWDTPYEPVSTSVWGGGRI